MTGASPKPVVWLGDSLESLRLFPKAVQDEVGYALYVAQTGGKYAHAKPLVGLGSGVLEIVSDHRGSTYRGVYTVRLTNAVYVLHVFQKKSKSGIGTPQSEMALIRQRLGRAIELHERRGH